MNDLTYILGLAGLFFQETRRTLGVNGPLVAAIASPNSWSQFDDPVTSTSGVVPFSGEAHHVCYCPEYIDPPHQYIGPEQFEFSGRPFRFSDVMDRQTDGLIA